MAMIFLADIYFELLFHLIYGFSIMKVLIGYLLGIRTLTLNAAYVGFRDEVALPDLNTEQGTDSPWKHTLLITDWGSCSLSLCDKCDATLALFL